MNWSRIASKLVSLGIVALSMAFMASCGGEGGGEGDEVVNLYIFNGYAGSKSMSLYGPSGKVVTGLGYGERTAEPVAVDRNLGSKFKLVIDGAPQSVELAFQLFTLYPHETGTLLFKKRNDVATASVSIYRHVRSKAETCRLVFDNAMSLSSEGLGQFGFIPLFEMANASAGGYERNEPINRNALMDQIDKSPYFALVPHFEEPAALMLVHAGLGTKIDHLTGIITTTRPTEDFVNCLGDDPPTNAEKCSKPVTYNTHVYKPDDQSQYWIDYPQGFLGAPNTCDAQFRISSDFSNIFTEASGILTSQKVKFPRGNHMFWILYGRPVDPGVLSFYPNNDETPYAELPPYPGQ